jgi:hypothetical protein
MCQTGGSAISGSATLTASDIEWWAISAIVRVAAGSDLAQHPARQDYQAYHQICMTHSYSPRPWEALGRALFSEFEHIADLERLAHPRSFGPLPRLLSRAGLQGEETKASFVALLVPVQGDLCQPDCR